MGKLTRTTFRHGMIWGALGTMLAADLAAVAQILPGPPVDPNQRQVYLVRKDQSDCTNSDVPNADSPLVAGNVWVSSLNNGTTSLKIAMTASPRTTYQFFLKCVRQLGDITTDDEGVANVTFSFPTNLVGAVYGFDMYPAGAPPGNKFQSARVSFQ